MLPPGDRGEPEETHHVHQAPRALGRLLRVRRGSQHQSAATGLWLAVRLTTSLVDLYIIHIAPNTQFNLYLYLKFLYFRKQHSLKEEPIISRILFTLRLKMSLTWY